MIETMRIPIITSFLFLVLFFILDRNSGEEGFHIQSIWAFQTSQEKEIFFSTSLEELPLPTVFSFQDNPQNVIRSFTFQNLRQAKKWSISPSALFHVPRFSDAWYQYTKNQNTVIYEKGSEKGNEKVIYWEKNYFGYPLSDSRGENLFIIAGDHSSVDIYDNNGQKQSTFSGIYLTHYCESYLPLQAQLQVILFSEGSFIVLSNGKNQKFTIEKEDNETLFLKSCALSVDGKKLAIHTLVQSAANSQSEKQEQEQEQEQEDQIIVYHLDPQEDPVVEDRFSLEKIYPHLLSMAVFLNGVLIGTKEATFFYSLENSDNQWRRELPIQGENYRPLLGLANYLLYSEENQMIVLGSEGEEMMRLPLLSQPLQFVFFPLRLEKETDSIEGWHQESEAEKRETFLVRYADTLQLYLITLAPQK